LFVFWRRLLQGSEAPLATKITWVTEEKKHMMQQKLKTLNYIADHIVDHINEPEINKEMLREVHG
jgi:hypothetical protein